MSHELPRELAEACLAAAQEATFQGFDDSVLASEFADPKRRRLMETIYRMGFESGWRIREKQIAAGVMVEATDEQIDAACSDVRHADHQDDPKGYDRAIARAVLAAFGVALPDGGQTV